MLNNHNKRYRPVTSAWFNEVSFDKIKRIYKDRFKSPGNFTFILTGKIDAEIAKPLVEKYLASLPSVKNQETWKNDGLLPPKGLVINDFVRENKTPRTSVYICYSGVTKYTAENSLFQSIIRHILELRYTETIREEKGGSYQVGVSANMREFPIAAYNIGIWFDTDPKQADELKSIVFREIKKIVENGPQEADLQKAKEFFLKQRQEALKDNNNWLGILVEYYFHHTNFFDGYEKMVNNLTVKSVQDYAQKVLTQGNIIQVIMRPKG
jgi:zinc protease